MSLAQTYWTESYGSPTNEEVLDVVQTSDDHSIVVGYFSGSLTLGATDLFSEGNSDILIAKLDATGNVIWAKRAGGLEADRAYAVAIDNADNIYVTGYFFESADFDGMPASGIDRTAFITKMNSDGDFLWVNTAGGEFGDTGYGVDVDDFGNVYFGGQFKGDGVFGSDLISSTFNPYSGEPSHDLFFSKLSASSGNFIWTRTGVATKDDRLLGIDTDEEGNIYIVGEFSDSITFDFTYNNTAENIGLMTKFDPAGTQIWFNAFKATQSILYDVEWKDDNLYVTGDYRGNLFVEHSGGTSSFAGVGDYSIFATQLDENGGLTWLSSKYSENEVTSKQIAVDNENDVFITGLFKCNFTELKEEYGNSSFISAGYRDIFIIEFNGTGEYQLGRQYGSERDDYCSGIVINAANQVVISGAHGGNYNTPAGPLFVGDFEEMSGIPSMNCGDPYYGHFSRHNSQGGKDIFLSAPFDPTRLPYDFYVQSGPCTSDTTNPCIMDCSDTIAICEPDSILVLPHHTIFGPVYDYEWSTGSTERSIFVNATGDFYVNYHRSDECEFYTDTVHVIYELPEPPLISDAWGYNDYNLYTNIIDTCDADTICVYGHPGDTTTVYLEWDFPMLDDSTICVSSTNRYFLSAYNEYGCYATNYIDIVMDTFALHDTLDPHILFADPMLEATDTIVMCEDEIMSVFLIDSSFLHPYGFMPNKYVFWYLDGVLEDSIRYFPMEFDDLELTDLSDGWHEINAILFNECADSVEYPLSRMFYVQNVNPVVNLSGPDPYLCPGDTITIEADHFGTDILWDYGCLDDFLDSAHYLVGPDSIWVYAQVDTIVGGKTCTGKGGYNINPYKIPNVYMDPEDGIICPGDSLLLTTPVGIEWEWIGPYGDVLGTDNTQYVNLPGFYHSIVTVEPGCVLTSHFVEAKEYSLPSLIIDEPVLCVDGIATVEVIAPPIATIEWLPPLSGSESVMHIDSAGTYYVETSFCDFTVLDSIIIEEGDVISEISILGDSIICPDEITLLSGNPGMAEYSWAPSGYSGMEFTTSDSGWYVLTVTDIYGCYGVSDTVWISHYPAPDKPVINDTLLCLGDDVMLDVVSSDSAYWYSLDGTLLSDLDYIEYFNVMDEEFVIVKLKDSLCFSEADTVYIGIHESSEIPTIYSDSLICEGDLALFSSDTSSAFTYVWILPDGSTIEAPTHSMISPDSTDSGIYGLYTYDVFCVSDTVYSTLEVIPSPTVHLSATDTLICPGDEVWLISTSTGDSIVWNDSSTNDSLLIDTPGEFSYMASSGECYNNSDTILIAFKPFIDPLDDIDSLICEGEDILIEIPSTDDITWLNLSDDTTHLGLSWLITDLDTNFTMLYFASNDSMCPSVSATASITVMSPDAPEILFEDYLCETDSAEICSYVDLGTYDTYYEWYLADTLFGEDECIIFSGDGGETVEIKLVVKSDYCETDTSFHTIEIIDSPYYYLPEDTVMCIGEEFIFDWPLDWEVDFIDSSLTDTVYVYTIYDEYGCSASDTLLINFIACTTFEPNVFTPDGDGINDYLTFDVDKGQLISLKIINRWGNEIYSGPYIDWDGYDSDRNPCSGGTYYFILGYEDFESNPGIVEGVFTLIR